MCTEGTVYTLEAADSVLRLLIALQLFWWHLCVIFLHSIRNSLIAWWWFPIPASLIATFNGVYLLGYTLNLAVGLLGLSLVVGILVDDAIVSIRKYLQAWKWEKTDVRYSLYEGTAEIGGYSCILITLK
jgi:HAE1 family hydrophobic/amphiphilic exporter-1